MHLQPTCTLCFLPWNYHLSLPYNFTFWHSSERISDKAMVVEKKAAMGKMTINQKMVAIVVGPAVAVGVMDAEVLVAASEAGNSGGRK